MVKLIRLTVIVPLIGVLLALAALAYAWSTSGAGPGDDGDPRLSHPSRELRLLMRRLAEVGTDGAAELLPEAKRALARAPLEEEPFVIAALVEQNRERYDEAVRLLDVARRRSARSFEARFLAVEANLAAGNISAAARDLEALLWFRGEQAKLAREALVLLAGHPDTGPAVWEALEEDRTRTMVLTELARAGAEPSVLLDAIRATRGSEAVKDDPQAIGGITRPLIEAGEFTGAYRVWSELSGKGSGGSDLLRDQRFEGATPPPFGWEVRSNSEGYAVLGSPGLAGESYGRRSMELARQFLLLPAGTYRLDVDVRDASDAIEARVQCQRGAEIVRMRLDRVDKVTGRFSVSPDCQAQWLELRARASDPPRADAFSIHSITIVKDAP